MKLKRILLILFLAIGLTGVSFAGAYDDWPDDAVCMWLDMKPTHEGYLGEAKKRSLTCEGGKAVVGAAPAKTTATKITTSTNKTTSTKSSGIKFYAIEFTEKLRKKLFDSIKDFFVEVDTSTKFDGQYTFQLFRTGDGTMGMGSGYITINNGEMIIEKDKRALGTGPKDLYDTFEAQIDENGQVYGSIRLDILGGKDRSEIYTLKGPIKKILGESPDECCLKIYFQLKPIKESSTSSTKVKVATSDGDPTVSKIIEVIEGDRFIVDIAEPHELAGSNITLIVRDIDAPDTIKSCSKEIELGKKVKDIVTQKLEDASSIKLKNIRKTSKAVIAQVIVDGKDLGEELVANDYASKEYGYWKAYICSAVKAISAGEQYLWAKDFEKAIFWLERGLVMDPDTNRRPGATYGLSLAYKQLGMDHKDYLIKAAELGVMHAELELGENYLNGWDGFEKDSSEGKYWLKKAHEHGSKDAEDACGCKF